MCEGEVEITRISSSFTPTVAGGGLIGKAECLLAECKVENTREPYHGVRLPYSINNHCTEDSRFREITRSRMGNYKDVLKDFTEAVWLRLGYLATLYNSGDICQMFTLSSGAMCSTCESSTKNAAPV